MIRIGIVVQRYGKEVVGGAETLARDVAERLAANGARVTVFTTTAKEYITWANFFRPGESILHGVRILRYPVECPRDIERFNRYSDEFFAADPAVRDDAAWLVEQGPFCPELLTGLREGQKEIDVFLFFTYLYYPTVEGLRVVEKPAVLFPTAHDEPPIHLPIMREMFARPQALFFLTAAEKELVERLFRPPGRLELVRSGLDIREHIDPALFRNKYHIYAPYLLYAGRIEKGKGLEQVFEYYRAIKDTHWLDLVLIGRKLMDIPLIDGIRYAGYVSEEEKLSAFRGALASLQPSPLESLSITTLESFSQRTPVLVNRRCGVLMEHVESSGGGLAYENADEFTTAVQRLTRRRASRQQMGQAGYEYVNRLYSWPVVMERILAGIRSLLPGAG